MERGQFESALKQAEESLEIARRLGEAALECTANNRVAQCLYFLGDYDGAVQKITSCTEFARDRLPALQVADCQVVLARFFAFARQLQ